MENNNNSTWENYGDVNPLEHGGIFVLSDEAKNGDAFKGCYYIEKIDRHYEEGKFVVSSLYVDVNADWIEKEKVIDYADTPKDDEIAFAVDCANYYNPLEFGNEIIFDTEEEVKEYFNKLGIEL